ncbi:capsid scaffold protein [Common bottlenose dolphin gammaherpesvirus 1 strain Sarasota]|nr:capsid scaffold protein [Common bottlenose dolphin gammaherpesvirus 1 strain Sarasota]ARW78080.1 capsid scaffold protein [Common bottlenose dolphin gammaherpesvirus 1 strain Sarasota]
MNAPVPGGSSSTFTPEDTISVPRSTFMSMLQTNLDSTKHGPPGPPKPPAPAPLDPYGAAAAGGAYPWQLGHAQFPPMFPPQQPPAMFQPYSAMAQGAGNSPVLLTYPQYAAMYGTPGAGYMHNGHYEPAPFPSRQGKRKREPEYLDDPVFPGEEHAVYRKDLASLTRSLVEIQNDLKDLKQRQHPQGFPQSHPWGAPAFSQYRPFSDPRNFGDPPQSFHCSTPYYNVGGPEPAEHNVPGPMPPPMPPKTRQYSNQSSQMRQQSPINPGPPATENEPGPGVVCDPPGKNQVPAVEASLGSCSISDNATAAQLQKIFCSELLSKS